MSLNRGQSYFSPCIVGLLAIFAPLLTQAQNSLVDFSNDVLGTNRFVLGVDGQPLKGTQWQAQLFNDTSAGLQVVPGSGSGFFSSAGVWDGGVRTLLGVLPGQDVQLEVRVWDHSLFSGYGEAIAAGGVTGSSGLFTWSMGTSVPLIGSDVWLKTLPVIQMVDQPNPPPLIVSVNYLSPSEGESVLLTPLVVGGKEPLKFLWQLPEGIQVTNRNLTFGGPTLRPGLVDLNLTVIDADGKSTLPFGFQIEVANEAPEIRSAIAKGAKEGERVSVLGLADYAWPSNAVRARWTLADGRTVEGLNASLPLLPPGSHSVKFQVSELGLTSLYNNLDSIGSPMDYHIPLEETGDEIIFTQTNQVVHEVSFVYFADLSAMTAAERLAAGGTLKIYRNDGPAYPGIQSKMPGTLLYESPRFGINSGQFLQRFSEVNIPTSDRLTWTVVWTNLTQSAGRNAGLVVGDTKANPASSNVGKSWNDFWVRSDTRWELFHLGDYHPVANFASHATAIGTSTVNVSPSVSVIFVVTNVPPSFTSVATPKSIVAAQLGSFQAVATDPGTGELIYRWAFGDGEIGVGHELKHAFASAGSYNGTVTVTDGFGGETRQNFIVEVTGVRRPLSFLTTPPIEGVQDKEYRGTVTVSPAASGQVITLQPVTLPSWLTWTVVSSTEGRLEGRPSNVNVGSHPVTIEAREGLTTNRLAFIIVVENVNDAPTLVAPATLQVVTRQGVSDIPLILSDPDNDADLELTVASGDPSLLPLDRLLLGGSGLNRTLSILPSGSASAGVVSVRLTVSDGVLQSEKVVQVTLVNPIDFAVTTAVRPGGSVSLSPLSPRYEEGFRLLATAKPQAGWELRQWTGLPEGPIAADDLEWVFAVSADTVLAAEFVDIASPVVTWISPAPGLVGSDLVTLEGQITDNDRVDWAQLHRPGVDPVNLSLKADGRYTLEGVRMAPGENPMSVVAQDFAGNKATNAVVLIIESGSILVVGSGADTREGQWVVFPVQLQNRVPLSGLSFNLHFEDYKDFLGNPEFEVSGLLPGALVTLNTNVPGVVRITIATLGESISVGQHPVGSLRLRVRSLLSSIGLTAYLDPELLEVSNELGDSVIGVSGISGKARLLPRRLVADLNGNNRLDIGDASLLQRLLVGLDTRRSWDAALNDLNRNGAIDSGDVVRLLRVVVGQDDQPLPRTQGEIWPAFSESRRSKMSAKNLQSHQWLELTPGVLAAPRGGLFEVQVRVREVPTQLRGLSFELAWPAQWMALQTTGGYSAGPALPSGLAPYWSAQSSSGFVRFALSSETNIVLKTGVLATFKFRVGSTVPAEWQGAFGLRNVESTADGYALDATRVTPTEVALAAEVLEPKLRRLRLERDGGIQFEVLATSGATLVIEGSDDLNTLPSHWTPLTTRIHDQKPLFLPPSVTGALRTPQRFYRLRTTTPALLTPRTR